MMEEPPDILIAKVENVRSVVTVLKAIAFKDKAMCEITEQGLKFTTENSQTLQAHAYLEAKIFDEYRYTPDHAHPPPGHNDNEDEGNRNRIVFNIDLDEMIECLTIFGGSSLVPIGGKDSGKGDGTRTSHSRSNKPETVVSLRMSLKRTIDELTLMLEENGVMTVCRLPTYDAEINMNMDQEFENSQLVTKLIISSEWLKYGFLDIDKTAESITLQILKLPPQMKVSATTAAGEIQMEFPKGSEVVEAFSCENTQEFRYQYQMIESSFKALTVSTKTGIKVNQMGFLSMQFLVPISDTDTCFVEYLCLPIADNEDEASDEDGY